MTNLIVWEKFTIGYNFHVKIICGHLLNSHQQQTILKVEFFCSLTLCTLYLSLKQPYYTFHISTYTYCLWSISVYWVTVALIEALHINTSISTKIPIVIELNLCMSPLVYVTTKTSIA